LAYKKISVISDTHGLLRPELLKALKGTGLIIHAGDIGKPEILNSLRELAPVVAVRGNVDKGLWADRLSLTEVIELGNMYTFVIHDINRLDIDLKAAGFKIMITGHTHKPRKEIIDGIMYLNPGSCGPRRFDLPTGFIQMEIDKQMIDVKWINLLQKS